MSSLQGLRDDMHHAYEAQALSGDTALASTPYDVGRRALENGIGLLDVVASHSEVARANTTLSDDVLLELLAPFEMAILGYRETIVSLDGANRRLGQSNADLAMFSNAMAHDLRNPLATILMWTELAQRRLDPADKQARGIIDAIKASAEHAANLVAGLLTLAQVEQGADADENCDLAVVVDEVLTGLTATISQHVAVIEAGSLPVVRGNRAQLEHLLQNLIENAIKYRGRDAPRIRLEAENSGPMWLIRCTDNGIGVNPSEREKIFEPFVRSQPAAAVTGSGLGLSICRRIVERHGGMIWVEEAPPPGTVIAFTLMSAYRDLPSGGTP